MRVLTYTSLFPNNIEPELGVFIFQRMSHFARRPGQSVEVVAPVPYFPRWLPSSRYQRMSAVPKQEQIGNLAVYHPRYPLAPKVSMLLHGWLMFLGSYRLVERLHASHHFDCIDAHYVYPDGFAAALLGKFLDIPMVVSARGTDMNLFPNFRLIRPLIHWTLQRVRGGIGVCTPLVDAMVAHGLALEHARMIGNGVDLARFQPVDPAASREHLKLPPDKQVLVAVGGLIPRKGFHLLIPAIAQVSKTHPDVRLYIVGKGPEKSNLEAIARGLGVQDIVSLVGPQPNSELKYWYSAANVSCLTSSREGWANILLESMACGTPVVATRVWGTPEVITSPEYGVMVEQEIGAIADGIDSALRRGWNRNAITQYAQRRTWNHVAAEVEEFLAAVCEPEQQLVHSLHR